MKQSPKATRSTKFSTLYALSVPKKITEALTDTQLTQKVRYTTVCPFEGHFAPCIFYTPRLIFEALKFDQGDYLLR